MSQFISPKITPENLILNNSLHTPVVLCIAGFDPSAGAGILSDIKTIEANNAYGYGVCTAITFQSDVEFTGVNWVKQKDIFKQLSLILKRVKFEVAKIGLIESFSVLTEIIDMLKHHNPEVKIIWDPIIAATAGFIFHENVKQNLVKGICKKIYLITPNLTEIGKLISGKSESVAAEELSKCCAVLLKGGHAESNKSTDTLFLKEEKYYFESNKIPNAAKHGSGCVLSSAIAASLAKGNNLKHACKEAKNYMMKFLTSNKTLLGYHSYAN